MIGFVGKVAISSIFDGFVACLAAPLLLWVPEGYPPCGGLWRPVGPLRDGLEPLCARRLSRLWGPVGPLRNGLEPL